MMNRAERRILHKGDRALERKEKRLLDTVDITNEDRDRVLAEFRRAAAEFDAVVEGRAVPMDRMAT